MPRLPVDLLEIFLQVGVRFRRVLLGFACHDDDREERARLAFERCLVVVDELRNLRAVKVIMLERQVEILQDTLMKCDLVKPKMIFMCDECKKKWELNNNG